MLITINAYQNVILGDTFPVTLPDKIHNLIWQFKDNYYIFIINMTKILNVIYLTDSMLCIC